MGIIVRTYHDFNSHEPLTDCLIISLMPVPPGILQSFLDSGVPSKGYAFVRFAKQELGHSLIAEQDLNLVSRNFSIGDSVKKHAADTMIGTVVSIFDSYVLEPICSTPKENLHKQHKPFEFHTGFQDCDEACVSQLPESLHHPLRHALLYDVPGVELKRADDYELGDYVIEQDYLGIVQERDIDAVLFLENGSLVVVENAWELELVVPSFDGPLVALPELDGLRRPDVVAYHVGGNAFIPTEHLSRGQFVITNQRNLRNGRWLFGEHDPKCSPQGHVLDVRTRRAHIKWLCPNAYASSASGDRMPSALRPYDNLGSYSNPRDLRRTKGLTLLDRGQRPPRSLEGKCSANINIGQDLETGDQVKFRDQSGALVKYQGSGHGQYDHVSREVTFGFDMNEFIVFFSKLSVKVRWQDGSVTEQPSVSLKPYVMPEQELCPGDVINLKEGSTQVAVDQPEATATEFNEMIYFQGEYILRPEKIGVVQSVNARERLVRVRWFLQPEVRLLQQGNVLQKGAYFGPISDDTEDVSLYEIMAYPALMRKHRDLVVVPPQKTTKDTLTSIVNHPRFCIEDISGTSLLSWARPLPGMDMYTYLREIAKPIAQRDLKDPNITHGDFSRFPLDWVGEIVDLGLDGMLTIRLCALYYCEEVRVPWERVLTIVDDQAAVDFEAGAPDAFMEDEMEDDHYMSDGSVISAIEETIEYEGGNRIDNESGDEGWSTDEGEPEYERIRRDNNSAMDIDTVNTSTTNSVHPKEDANKLENTQLQDIAREEDIFPQAVRILQSSLFSLPPEQSPPASIPEHPPPPPPPPPKPHPTSNITKLIDLATSQTHPTPSFLVLDTPPPPDQFLGPDRPHSSSTHPTASPTFLKRLHREHLTLSHSLPPTQIYLRTYSSRIDLLRALILGPADTPYESAPFVIDLYLPPTYPSVPPIAHFHSWTSGLGRINPNLYEEGKICLSLLGTWPGRGEGEADTWSESANLLQVLLSLMGLVLVKRPFYNEAGFEGYEGDGAYEVESLLYSEKAYVLARGFVRYALLGGVAGVEDVLGWVYLGGGGGGGDGGGEEQKVGEVDGEGKGKAAVLTSNQVGLEERPQLLRKLIQRARALMDYSSVCTGEERDQLVDGAGEKNAEAFIRPLSQGAVVMLRRHLEVLENAFQNHI